VLPIYCSFPTSPAAADVVYPPGPGEFGLSAGSGVARAEPTSQEEPEDQRMGLHDGSAKHGRDPLVQLDRELAEIDRLLATAHFHTVLALTRKSRGQLDTLEPDAGLASRRIQLEVMAATAEIALGRRSQARRSLQRALGMDAGLVLDEQATSPKVSSLLRELRSGNGPEVQ
jgi:hypothetical protein